MHILIQSYIIYKGIVFIISEDIQSTSTPILSNVAVIAGLNGVVLEGTISNINGFIVAGAKKNKF